MDEWRLVGHVDLFFVPCNMRGRMSLGHAIVNFTSHEAADRFAQEWHGQLLEFARRARPLEVSRSRIQGFQPSLEHIAQSARRVFSRRARLPLIFEGSLMLDSRQLLMECLPPGSTP